MIYHVYKVFFDQEWQNMFIVPGFVYDIYLSAVVDCQVEELIYDLFEFCDKHNCTAMKIIENDIASIFQITGIINGLCAVTYEKLVNYENHSNEQA